MIASPFQRAFLGSGSPHARDVTSTTTSGSEKPRPAPVRTSLQSAQAFLTESSAPLADDLSQQIQPAGNLRVLGTFGRERDDPSPNNVAIR